MTGPTKHLEKLVVEKGILHTGCPVLRWNMSNVTLAEDAAGNIKPDKKRSGEKIDGTVATIMGIGCALLADEGVYEITGV